MDALAHLLSRHSCGQLTAPAPTDAQLDTLLQCALRAPDHGQVRPYRFLLISGERLSALGQVYVKALQADGETDASKLERAQGLPQRAPMILVAIFAPKEHPKAPEQEQLITAGIATANIVSAAQTIGLGAYWRTGELAYHALVAQALALQAHERVIGFIYIGTPKDALRKPAAVVDTTPLLQTW